MTASTRQALSATPTIRLVVTYFGPRPAYLPLVLKSMAANPDIDWLFFTEKPIRDAPLNVDVRICEFDEIAARIKSNFEFDICIDDPYKMCDFRPAFGEIFAAELAGYDFWGHCDVDVLFGRIRDHLPPAAFEADKILFQGNFALYRNTAEAARWYRHEVGRVSYRDSFTTAAATHFDEWAGIYYIVVDLNVRYWQRNVIFDLSFFRYCTRAEDARGRGARRYAWEDGEVAEYRIEGGEVVRRTALLVHFQKRTMRAPGPDVLDSDRWWITANGFTPQMTVSPSAVRAAGIPIGHEIFAFYGRRLRRSVRRRAARRAARSKAMASVPVQRSETPAAAEADRGASVG